MPPTKSSSLSSTKPKFVLKRQHAEGEKSSNDKKKTLKRARVEELDAPTSKPTSPSECNEPKSILKTTSKLDKGKGVRHVDASNPIPVSKSPTSLSTKAKRPKLQTSSTTTTPAPLPPAFKLIAGSYEKLLYGLQGSISISEENPSSLHFSLKPLFIFPAHVSSVKAVAASPGPVGGKWLATGSADEIIKVWDLRRQKEVGGLMHHNGSITHLVFADRSHLFSASEDGTLAIFHARDWAVLRTFKGHKGRVNALAVHPSRKLALSTGKDRTLRMWDLIRGKASASTKIYKEGEVLRWNNAGTKFALASGSSIDIYTVDMTILHAITHPARIHDVLFAENPADGPELLLVAAENKKVATYTISAQPSTSAENEEEATERSPKIFAEFVGHVNRVKAIATLRVALPTSAEQTRQSTTILSSVSSDGTFLLYDLHALADLNTQPEAKDIAQVESNAKYDTNGTRLICLTIAEDTSPGTVLGKDKSGGEDEESEDEETIFGKAGEGDDEDPKDDALEDSD